jgi:Mg-chelatase subunit ChlI
VGYDSAQLAMLAKAISEFPESVGDRIAVGIDGCGGAGKSTLAKALCQLLPHCQVIHTDDFASWEEPIEWWERMQGQVLLPLREGRQARYQRYNWTAHLLEE